MYNTNTSHIGAFFMTKKYRKYKIRRVVGTKVVIVVTEYWCYEADWKYNILN